jgi:hypothetical protein
MPREGYQDDVRTKAHALALVDYFEKAETFDNSGWPMVVLGPVLPSARAMIVRALRDLAEKLPTD